MDISITRENTIIYVHVKMNPRTPLERKIRFYVEDAREAVLKKYPDIGELVPGDWQANTISNYREPYEGIWSFYIQDENHEMFKRMADEFEKKNLMNDSRSDTMPKRKTSKKRKENES